MIDKVTNMIRYGNDINVYLITMFKAIQLGWEPLDYYDEKAYSIAKEKIKRIINYSFYEIAEIGFIGIGCSYAGKWFGGYARGNTDKNEPRNYTKESKNNLLKQKIFIQDVVFSTTDYENMFIPETPSIIYCDPPYFCTTKYNYNNYFNTKKFWNWCNEMCQKGHKLFVSEYEAPDDWNCIWFKEVYNSLTKETGNKKGIEKLFFKKTC